MPSQRIVTPRRGPARSPSVAKPSRSCKQLRRALQRSHPVQPTSRRPERRGPSSVTASAGCDWTATSNAAWITISAGANGSGNGSVTYGVAANPDTTSRTGALTIGGNTYTVTQAGTTCAPTLSAPSANVAAAGASGSVAVTASAGCAWTATSNAAWVTVTAGATGSGNDTVIYVVTPNPATTSRTGDADDRRQHLHDHPGWYSLRADYFPDHSDHRRCRRDVRGHRHCG